MHKIVALPSQPDRPRLKAAARRRRLTKGVDRWLLDLKVSPEPPRRALLLTFTTTGDWERESQNRMRRFWNDVRNTFVGARYFCWAELTRAGQLHYHAWWVNPPNAKRVHITSWLKRHWGSDRTQISFPQDSWRPDALAVYVKKYVRKMGRKAEQQRYATMPREFRTFMNQRLDLPATELDDHLDKDLWVYQPRAYVGEEELPPRLVLTGRRFHEIPRGGHCSLVHAPRRPGRAPPSLHREALSRGSTHD